MAFLSPEQQLALAHQQMSPGLGGGYASQVEQQATSLTQGVTGFALPALGLGAAVGLDFAGLDPISLGMRGASLGGRIGGGGMLARGAGLIAGGAAGAGITFGATAAVTAATNRIIAGQREFMATRQLLREMPTPGFGPQSVLSGAQAPMTGPSVVSQFQNTLSSMAGQFGSTTGQMRNLAAGFGQMGMLNMSNPDQMSQSFRQSVTELGNMAKRINADLETAMQVYQNLKNMGFDTRAQRARALTGMTATSSLTGMSLPQVNQFATQSMQTAQSMGLNGQVGFNTGLSTLTTTAMRVGGGMVPNNILQQYGGVQGMAQRMTELQLNVGNTYGGQAMMSQLFDPGLGTMREGALSNFLGGGSIRFNRNFMRNADPYNMSNMQGDFTNMSRGLILSRLNQIQSSNPDDRLARNRSQFEFLSQMGVSDPNEQLEFISTLRNQPRAQFAQTMQSMVDTARGGLGGGGGEDQRLMGMVQERVRSVFRELTNNIGNELERFGAALQVRAERLTRAMNEAIAGPGRSRLGTGAVSMDALSEEGMNVIRGDFSAFQNPMDRLAEQMQDPSMRALAGRAFAPGRRTNLSEFSGVERFLGGGAVSLARSVRSSGDALSRVFGGGGGGDRRGLSGLGPNATAGEIMQAVGQEFGVELDPETGRVARADSRMVESILMRSGRAFEQMEVNALESMREESRESSTGRFMRNLDRAITPGPGPGFGEIARGMMRNFSENQGVEAVMGPMTDSERLAVAENRDAILDRYAREAFDGRSMSELNPEERASLTQAIIQQGGEFVAELFPDVGDTEGMNEFQIGAIVQERMVRQGLTETLSGGGFASRGVDRTGGGPGAGRSVVRAMLGETGRQIAALGVAGSRETMGATGDVVGVEEATRRANSAITVDPAVLAEQGFSSVEEYVEGREDATIGTMAALARLQQSTDGGMAGAVEDAIAFVSTDRQQRDELGANADIRTQRLLTQLHYENVDGELRRVDPETARQRYDQMVEETVRQATEGVEDSEERRRIRNRIEGQFQTSLLTRSGNVRGLDSPTEVVDSMATGVTDANAPGIMETMGALNQARDTQESMFFAGVQEERARETMELLVQDNMDQIAAIDLALRNEIGEGLGEAQLAAIDDPAEFMQALQAGGGRDTVNQILMQLDNEIAAAEGDDERERLTALRSQVQTFRGLAGVGSDGGTMTSIEQLSAVASGLAIGQGGRLSEEGISRLMAVGFQGTEALTALMSIQEGTDENAQATLEALFGGGPEARSTLDTLARESNIEGENQQQRMDNLIEALQEGSPEGMTALQDMVERFTLGADIQETDARRQSRQERIMDLAESFFKEINPHVGSEGISVTWVNNSNAAMPVYLTQTPVD